MAQSLSHTIAIINETSSEDRRRIFAAAAIAEQNVMAAEIQFLSAEIQFLSAESAGIEAEKNVLAARQRLYDARMNALKAAERCFSLNLVTPKPVLLTASVDTVITTTEYLPLPASPLPSLTIVAPSVAQTTDITTTKYSPLPASPLAASPPVSITTVAPSVAKKTEESRENLLLPLMSPPPKTVGRPKGSKNKILSPVSKARQEANEAKKVEREAKIMAMTPEQRLAKEATRIKSAETRAKNIAKKKNDNPASAIAVSIVVAEPIAVAVENILSQDTESVSMEDSSDYRSSENWLTMIPTVTQMEERRRTTLQGIQAAQ